MTDLRNIGDLGVAREPVQATFGYFGLQIRVHPEVSDLDLVEFLMGADSVDEQDQVKGMLAIGRYLRNLVHPDDWDPFWRASKANRQTLQDLMVTAHRITEAAAQFPTGQPSGSAAGRPSTAARSGAGSSSPDIGRALTLVKGRPDLQSAIVRAQEARRASA